MYFDTMIAMKNEAFEETNDDFLLSTISLILSFEFREFDHETDNKCFSSCSPSDANKSGSIS